MAKHSECDACLYYDTKRIGDGYEYVINQGSTSASLSVIGYSKCYELTAVVFVSLVNWATRKQNTLYILLHDSPLLLYCCIQRVHDIK